MSEALPKGLEVGEVYALGLSDRQCPVGMVQGGDAQGIHITPFSWLLGLFSLPDEWIGSELIVRWMRAERLPEGYDGWSSGTMVYDMEPLGDFQTRWVDVGQLLDPRSIERLKGGGGAFLG